MSNKLSNIIANANDFDGVFYKPHKVADYFQQFVEIFADTLVKMFPDKIGRDSARSISIKGYNEYGDSVTALMAWAHNQGMNKEEVRDRFFQNYHINLRHHFLEHAPHVFQQPSKLSKVFAPLSGIVRQGIATHGCANEFIRPLLPTMELTPYIEPTAIFGLADSGFLKKSTHPDLVMMCLNALGVPPEVAGYTEDTIDNLRTNKEHMPELTTVFIHNGRPLESKPSFVDYQFRSFADYLRALHAAHSEPRDLILI